MKHTIKNVNYDYIHLEVKTKGQGQRYVGLNKGMSVTLEADELSDQAKGLIKRKRVECTTPIAVVKTPPKSPVVEAPESEDKKAKKHARKDSTPADETNQS